MQRQGGDHIRIWKITG